MHARPPIQVAVDHAAADHVAIDVHVPVARMHVGVRDLDVRTRAQPPATGVTEVRRLPAVVVERAPRPVEVVVQPAADGISRAERPAGCRKAERVERAPVDRVRVVCRHVDHARLRRCDHIVVRLAADLHLGGTAQVALPVGHRAQSLHGRHHVAGLQRMGASERRGPVAAIGHRVQRRGVVRDRLHAHVPRLVVDAVGAVGAHVSRGLLDLVGEGRCDQHLRQQRVRVQRDRSHEVVQFLGRETFAVVQLVLRDLAFLCLRQRR